jgi:hypothetical protein
LILIMDMDGWSFIQSLALKKLICPEVSQEYNSKGSDGYT